MKKEKGDFFFFFQKGKLMPQRERGISRPLWLGAAQLRPPAEKVPHALVTRNGQKRKKGKKKNLIIIVT